MGFCDFPIRHQVHENTHHRFPKQAEPSCPTASGSWEEASCMLRLLRCLSGLCEHSYPQMPLGLPSKSSILSDDFKDGKIVNISSHPQAPGPRPLGTSRAMKAWRIDEATQRDSAPSKASQKQRDTVLLPSHWGRVGVGNKQSREAEDHQVYLKSLNNVSQSSKH